MINSSLTIYFNDEYVSALLMEETEFLARMNASVNDFQSRTYSSFQHILELIRVSVEGNQFVTGSFTNGLINTYTDVNNSNQRMSEIWWVNSFDLTCNCGTSATACRLPIDAYCVHAKESQGASCYDVPGESFQGFILSCEPFDGFLASTLECPYTQTCLQNILQSVYQINNTALLVVIEHILATITLTNQSRFAPTTEIIDIINVLMVDRWIQSVSFDSYYEQCRPEQCQYTITRRLDIVTTVVSLIGIFAGLSVIIRIVAPFIVRLLRKIQCSNLSTVRAAWTTGKLSNDHYHIE